MLYKAREAQICRRIHSRCIHLSVQLVDCLKMHTCSTQESNRMSSLGLKMSDKIIIKESYHVPAMQWFSEIRQVIDWMEAATRVVNANVAGGICSLKSQFEQISFTDSRR